MTSLDWVSLTEHFGLGDALGVPAYVARGAMGEIWRLETGRGSWAVKWQFPWAPPDPRPGDLRVQAAAAGAGIPLPAPVLTAAGDAVVLAGDRRVRVYEWADVEDPGEPPVGAAAAAEAGRLLGLLHGLALPAPGFIDAWYTQSPPPRTWAALADRASAAGAAWGSPLAGASVLLAELEALIGPPPGTPPIACHRDFSPDNVRARRPGGQLVVLDWEDAGPLHAERELGYVLLGWAASGPHFDAAAAEALLGGYAAASGGRPELGAGCFGTAVAARLNFLYVMASQALDDPAHRSFAERQVASMLEHDLDDLRSSIRAAARTLSLH
jgi:Ser/Thr protein kinase RdoA (MazF antagonist)